jgi:serine/threonine protein kinase
MAAAATVEDLLELLRKSRLVEPAKLDGYFANSHTPIATTPKGVAELLVRDGLITGFQAEQLLLGKYRGFDLGKYRLLERLGAGGMGQVFLAQHQVMRRQVAIKVLPPKQAADPKARERFMRESRAAGALTHPNIVRAYDVDESNGLLFLIMEFVDGCSLQQLVAEHGPLAPHRAAYYLWQAAVGLQHAHEAGLVHRDIKPSNLLLDRQGVVKLLDLGLARFFHDHTDELTKDEGDRGILGTADYLAPEQALDSHEVDIRGDVYSLGATGYFLLTGRSPFADGNTAQKLLAHQMREPAAIKQLRPDVPDDVVAVVSRMMRKHPGERYQTPGEAAAALERWAHDPPPPPSAEEMPKRCRALSSGGPGSNLSGRSPSRRAVPSSRRMASPGPLAALNPKAIAAAAALVLVCSLAGAWKAGWLGGATRTPADAPPALPPQAKINLGAPAPASPSQLVVSRAGGDNYYSTLAAALANARPGDQIVVREPLLREAVTIAGSSSGAGKNIALIGEPPGGGRVRWLPPEGHPRTAPLLTLAVVESFTVRGFDFAGDDRTDHLVAVTGFCPELTLENLTFSHFARVGVAGGNVAGGDGRPARLRGCRFHDGSATSQAGAWFVAESGQHTRRLDVADCRFEGPSAAGLVLVGPAESVTVSGSRWHRLTQAIRWDAGAGSLPLGLTVRHNTFGETRAAIALAAVPDLQNPATRVVVQNNLFANSAQAAGALPVTVQGLRSLIPETEARLIWANNAPNPYVEAPVGTVVFRKTFDLGDRPPARATLDYLIETEGVIWLNGHALPSKRHTLTYRQVPTAEVGRFLRPGVNTIAVFAENKFLAATVSPTNGAWFVLRLAWEEDGKPREVVTDGTWRVAKEEEPGWKEANFNDSAWGRAKELSASSRSRLPMNYVWDSQALLLGDLPARLFPEATGNVRHTTRVNYTPFITEMKPLPNVDLPSDPLDDAHFLRYPPDHVLATKYDQVGAGSTGRNR